MEVKFILGVATILKQLLKIVGIILSLFIILLGFGFLYETIQRSGNSMAHEPVGTIFSYGEKEMHYIKKGAGDTTVIFSSGNGTASPYADMYPLQEVVSDFAETIIYERPGYGWSEATDKERSIEQLVKEMEAVLEHGQANDSLILIGHSMAALELIGYAQKYPERIKGIVLIDGVQPEYAEDMEHAMPLSIQGMRFLKRIGIFRLLSQFDTTKHILAPVGDLPEDVKEIGIDMTVEHMWNQTMIAERKALAANGATVSEAGPVDDLPLILFSATDNPMAGWTESQKQFGKWSENTKQIWVETENHFLHEEAADQIIEEIRRLVQRSE